MLVTFPLLASVSSSAYSKAVREELAFTPQGTFRTQKVSQQEWGYHIHKMTSLLGDCVGLGHG